MTRVVLHIDRLVLRGVPAAQREAVVRQLEAALSREFAAPGVAQAWTASGHRATLRARFEAPSAALLGDTAARALAVPTASRGRP
ncbi:MAG: hypothetical protein V4569_13880 [Pseudomonadota bacterium]